MTFKEIIIREDANQDCIWLYREGIFMKAYERSAFFMHTYIKDFKLSKRYVKSVNMDVVSMGFPENSVPKWLNGYVYEYVADGLIRCQMRDRFDEVKFHHWKELILINAADKYTPNTSVIEKSPIYKTAYDFLMQVLSFTAHISKNLSNPIGLRLKEMSYKLCFLIRTMYDSDQPSQIMNDAEKLCTEIKFILQILKDSKEISINTYALSSERIVSVSKQLYLLHQKVKAE